MCEKRMALTDAELEGVAGGVSIGAIATGLGLAGAGISMILKQTKFLIPAAIVTIIGAVCAIIGSTYDVHGAVKDLAN